jgi:uncharacterized protein YkwD
MKRLPLLLGFCLAALLAFAGSAPALGQNITLGNPDTHTRMGSGEHTLYRGPGKPGVADYRNRKLAESTGCAGADDATASAAVQEQAMKCLVNGARDSAGLPKLADLRSLDTSSDNKAADIIRCNQFSHEACGHDFLYWMRRSGFVGGRCWWAGENIAWGTGDLGSPRSIFNAWMHSPPHRANILSSQFQMFGISLRVGGLAGNSNAHVWVNHFGSHC